jgi:hypothetical protein
MKSSKVKKPSKTKLYEYVIDVSPSKYLYTDKKSAAKDAQLDWDKYRTTELPHLNHINYKEAIKQGIVWFSSKVVK